MQRVILAAGVLVVLSGACARNKMAESSGELAERRAVGSETIPRGAVLEGRLDHSLTAARARIGDAFSIKLSSDATTRQHAAAVPPGSIVYGHIAALDLNNRSGVAATAQLALDSLVYSGHHHHLDANISGFGYDKVSVRPVGPMGAAGTATPVSLTLLSFTNADGQLPAGSPVTLIVTNPIRLEPR